MAIVGVHATTPKERDQMQAALLRCGYGAPQAGHLREGAVSNGRINARKILWYALSTADVQVANLAVPHLASRKSNRFAARSECRIGVLRAERTPVRHRGGSNGITCAAVADAKPVNDD
jgi:hypothetical protein